MLEHLHYALLLGFCLVIALPLEMVGAGVYRQPRRLVAALAVPAALFVAWDVLAVARGHWSFDGEQVLQILRPGGLPVEELAFFLVVPLCTILTLEAVRGLHGRRQEHQQPGPIDA